jgi:hypothetical protein
MSEMLRLWLAKKLAPQQSKDADRFWHLLTSIDDAYRWLAERHDAADLAQWLLELDTDHRRAEGEPRAGKLPRDIYDLRELMRRRALEGGSNA